MPVLSSSPLSTIQLGRDVIANLSSAATVAADAANATGPPPWEVICAFPVSGQYGIGSRILYYCLVATCVFARKAEWLRNACLAAALIFPAVAAFHAIVLAATHNDRVVDMDVFGAFQLCSIGVLTAPVTALLSRTYFNDPGRNIIFLWTGLVLAGLLSLTVEFYRLEPIPCRYGDDGQRISPALGPSSFPYDSAKCGLVCVPDDPNSKMRGGAAKDVHVIPAPDVLKFGTATLLAAACCIPAILSMVSMWNKILEINWKRRWGNYEAEKRLDEPIEGTNGATVGRMRHVNGAIRRFLSVIEAPFFVAAVLAILIVGELNFFSSQVYYETEPMASIGQWAPMVGTFLAALGSFHILAADEGKPTHERPSSLASESPCNCPHHPGGLESTHSSPRSSRDHGLGTRHSIHESPQQKSWEMHEGDIADVGLSTMVSQHSCAPSRGRTDSIEQGRGRVATPDTMHTTGEVSNVNSRSRSRIAAALNRFGEYIGTPRSDLFDDSAFRRGKAAGYPVIPGEKRRVPDLYRIKSKYKDLRHLEEEYMPELRRQRSRAGSFTNAEPASPISRSVSPNPSQPGRSPSRAPYPVIQAPRSNTLPTDPTTRGSCEPLPRNGKPRRCGTLEVPSPDRHHPPPWGHLDVPPSSGPSVISSSGEQSPPRIVVSPDPGTANHTPALMPVDLEVYSPPPGAMPPQT